MKYPFLVAAVTASFGLALACSTTTLVQPGEDGGGPPAGDPTVDAGTPDPAADGTGRLCSDDSDCTAGLGCVNRACVPRCTNRKCEGGGTCVGNLTKSGCFPRCEASADCPNGLVCNYLSSGDGRVCAASCEKVGCPEGATCITEAGADDRGLCKKGSSSSSSGGSSSGGSSSSGSSGTALACPSPMPTTSGITPSKPMTSLTAADIASLCDWGACLQGGYGKSKVCSGTTVSTPASQATCVGKYRAPKASCTATIADLEPCLHAAQSGDLCASTQTLLGDPVCAKYKAYFF